MTESRHSVTFRQEVLAATDRLPYCLVQALWLVDVCHLDYNGAANTLNLPKHVLARRLHSARRGIRHLLATAEKEGFAT